MTNSEILNNSMKITKIEWTDSTWSPWYGCTKCSPGCEHCYAESLCRRFKLAQWGDGAERVRNEKFDTPLRWDRLAKKSRTRRFVFPSLCDPFDGNVPNQWRVAFLHLIKITPHLTWLLLTKRPQNVPDELPTNAWLGVSICNQKECDEKIPRLLAVDATKRFVSCEPLLGPIQFPNFGCTCGQPLCGGPRRIDWVIVGGESGPGARPMQYDWVDSIHWQCINAPSVSFMFKQWGEWAPFLDTENKWKMVRVGKKAAGRRLDGKEYLERPTL